MTCAMIVIVDYEMGNLHSMAKALEYAGGKVRVSKDPRDLVAAEKIVLPGVGAFPHGMAQLKNQGLSAVLREEAIKKHKPLLGVCLGMQLLADESEEFGAHQGLGFISGQVIRFKVDAAQGLPVPHVGWNSVTFLKDHPLLAGIPGGADFYFVHSFHFQCRDADDAVAICRYGNPFTAIVAKHNIFATQFHPEKSQKYGLQILKNFVQWQPA